jgi:hypothetical protein
MSLVPYQKTYDEIVKACAAIQIGFDVGKDGRIESAIKEKEYLDKLNDLLIASNPDFWIVRPGDRYWYDIKINEIPINLKLTVGGGDNALNKTAIAYSMSGDDNVPLKMNIGQFFEHLKKIPKKEVRDRSSEYHYLVLNKNTGQLLFKSIFDIHSYKSNPSNIMQINWTKEFLNADYKVVSNEDYKAKVRELLKTVQRSVKQLISSMDNFASADIDSLF